MKTVTISEAEYAALLTVAMAASKLNEIDFDFTARPGAASIAAGQIKSALADLASASKAPNPA